MVWYGRDPTAAAALNLAAGRGIERERESERTNERSLRGQEQEDAISPPLLLPFSPVLKAKVCS